MNLKMTLQKVIEIALGGKTAGQIFDGDRRFDLVVRLPENIRTDLAALKNLSVPLANSEHVKFVPLSELASFDIAIGPNQINRENSL